MIRLFKRKRCFDESMGRYVIFFNGGWVGVYYAYSLSKIDLNYYLKDFPSDPNPITILDLKEFD